MKSPATAIVSLLSILLILAAGVNYFFIDRPFESKPTPASQTVVTPAPTGGLSMSLAQKIERLRGVAREVSDSGQPQEINLSLTEAELNEEAGRLLAQGRAAGEVPLDISGVSADLQPEGIITTGVDAKALNISFRIKVRARVGVKDGKPVINIEDIEVPLILSSFKDMIGEYVRQKTEGMLAELSQSVLDGNGGVVAEFIEISTTDQELISRLVLKKA